MNAAVGRHRFVAAVYVGQDLFPVAVATNFAAADSVAAGLRKVRPDVRVVELDEEAARAYTALADAVAARQALDPAPKGGEKGRR